MIKFTDYSIHTGSPQKAESDRFIWSAHQDSDLRDKLAGKTIYQMAYMRTDAFGSDPVDDATKALAREFWAALRAEQARSEAAHQVNRVEDEDREGYPVDEDKAREYDNLQNEGYSDGYNPYR